MGLADNSGDILLDVVLTDTGRQAMANGTFKVVKYAFFDDEVDYELYDKTHSSGSAYFDLNILQTPIFEAVANNTSSGKSKLLSIQRNNLLFLPVLKLNRQDAATDLHSSNSFLVAVDKDTEDNVALSAAGHVRGIQFGQRLDPAGYILIEQGLDTTEIPAALNLDPELVETQYQVEIDNRFGKIVSITDKSIATPSFIDDDNIASYYFSLGTTPNFVLNQWPGKTTDNTSDLVVRGPRGTRLRFMIAASIDLATSTTLFTQLGSTATIENVSCYFIDTLVRVTGGTTGFAVDIPVRMIKQV